MRFKFATRIFGRLSLLSEMIVLENGHLGRRVAVAVLSRTVNRDSLRSGLTDPSSAGASAHPTPARKYRGHLLTPGFSLPTSLDTEELF